MSRAPAFQKSGKLVGILSQADLIFRLTTLKVARLLKSVAKKTRKQAFALV